MTQKFLKYTHPASMGFDTNKSYELEELKKEFDLELIKVLFVPIGWEFDDLEVKKIVNVNKKQED